MVLSWLYKCTNLSYNIDNKIAGPSKPKRRYTEREMKQTLSARELEEIADSLNERGNGPFEDSGSEFDLYCEDVSDASEARWTKTEALSPTQSNQVQWKDVADLKRIPFTSNPGLRVELQLYAEDFLYV